MDIEAIMSQFRDERDLMDAGILVIERLAAVAPPFPSMKTV
jgi:hypothetical protein